MTPKMSAVVVVLWALAGQAWAQEVSESETPLPQIKHTWEKPFAFGSYGVGWAGSYMGGGLGGRVEWQPFDYIGIRIYSDHLMLQSPSGTRHDHPVGFDAYVPIKLSDDLRIRPMFGFCTVFSFVEPEQANAPRADDVLFGPHLGVGFDWITTRNLTAFAELQGVAWVGHDRAIDGWSGTIGDLEFTGVVQLVSGFSFYVGG